MRNSADMPPKRRHGLLLTNLNWLTEEVYREKIQPRFARVTVRALSSALGVSEPYAAAIRAGSQRPHPRHWQALARLVPFLPMIQAELFSIRFQSVTWGGRERILR